MDVAKETVLDVILCKDLFLVEPAVDAVGVRTVERVVVAAVGAEEDPTGKC